MPLSWQAILVFQGTAQRAFPSNVDLFLPFLCFSMAKQALKTPNPALQAPKPAPEPRNQHFKTNNKDQKDQNRHSGAQTGT